LFAPPLGGWGDTNREGFIILECKGRPITEIPPNFSPRETFYFFKQKKIGQKHPIFLLFSVGNRQKNTRPQDFCSSVLLSKKSHADSADFISNVADDSLLE
jgi:hypothetical protein